MLATSAALSAEKTIPPDPITLLVPTTEALPATLATINAQNQPTNHEPQPARTDVTPADPTLRDTINTIFDGFASGGSTSSARKRHLCYIQSINHITNSHHRHRML